MQTTKKDLIIYFVSNQIAEASYGSHSGKLQNIQVFSDRFSFCLGGSIIIPVPLPAHVQSYTTKIKDSTAFK